MKSNLQGKQFFHGTTHPFSEGDILSPHDKTLHGPSTGKHVYLTSRDIAEEYAEMAVEQRMDMGDKGPLVPRVFEVEPIGNVEPDPSGMRLLDDDDNEYTDDVRAPKARIIRQVWQGSSDE